MKLLLLVILTNLQYSLPQEGPTLAIPVAERFYVTDLSTPPQIVSYSFSLPLETITYLMS